MIDIKAHINNVALHHTIFDLPFAFMAAFLASNGHPRLWDLFWIALAITSGRAAAMAMAGLAACSSGTSEERPAKTPDEGVVPRTIQEKCRTVITTDGEVDDRDSVIRALLYANEMDIAGIVLTSSMYHYAGDGDKVEPFRWTGTQWLTDFLDAYEQVYPNLCVHAEGYPEPDFLREHTKIGNIKDKGEMEEVTEGSEFLKELFLDDDPRTLWVQT